MLGCGRPFTPSRNLASVELRPTERAKTLVRGATDQCLEAEPNRLGVRLGARDRFGMLQQAFVDVQGLFHTSDLAILVWHILGRDADAEDIFAARNTGAVFIWTPGASTFHRRDGTELPGNNGIETSADGREFLVMAMGLRRIVAFSRADPSRPIGFAQLAGFNPETSAWSALAKDVTR